MPGHIGQMRDVEVVRQICRHFPGSRILVDFNDTCTLEQEMEFVEATQDIGIYWIEAPFCENYEAYLRLKECLARLSPNTLIADGESRPDTG